MFAFTHCRHCECRAASDDKGTLADGRIAFVVIPVKNGFPSGTTLSRVYDPVSGSVDSDFITIAPASGYRALSPQLTLLTSGNLVVT